MTYAEWTKEHKKKVEKIQRKLEKKGYTKQEVIAYFNWDNMVKKEKDFCGLYKDNKKCHNMDNLNCYLCGCPHFKCSDIPLFTRQENKVFSVCGINSNKAKTFTVDNNTHCDCSDCFLPHKTHVAEKHYIVTEVEDSVSMLDTVRAYQLWDILKKYKLF